MRPLREQADEFIEAFFDGSIVTLFSRVGVKASDETYPIVINELNTKMISSLVNEKIPHYLALVTGVSDMPKISDEDLTDLAFNIFGDVLKLRAVGAITNNPDTLKETTYWKNRCLTVELESAEKEKKIRSLVEDIDKLRVGRSGIK